MIRLTRLNQNELVINAEMIEFVEAIPDIGQKDYGVRAGRHGGRAHRRIQTHL